MFIEAVEKNSYEYNFNKTIQPSSSSWVCVFRVLKLLIKPEWVVKTVRFVAPRKTLRSLKTIHLSRVSRVPSLGGLWVYTWADTWLGGRRWRWRRRRWSCWCRSRAEQETPTFSETGGRSMRRGWPRSTWPTARGTWSKIWVISVEHRIGSRLWLSRATRSSLNRPITLWYLLPIPIINTF